MNNLVEKQRAAHAAWLACPERTRADKARKAGLAADLSAAAQAVATAKRALAPAPAQPAITVGQLTDKMLARQVGNAAAKLANEAVRRAARLYEAASEYPRCLQGWPCGAAEEAADELLHVYSAIAEQYL